MYNDHQPTVNIPQPSLSHSIVHNFYFQTGEHEPLYSAIKMSVVSGALDVSGGTPPLLARPSSPQSGNNKELESSHKLTPARFSIEKGFLNVFSHTGF